MSSRIVDTIKNVINQYFSKPTPSVIESKAVTGSMAIPSWANLSADDARAEADMYSRLYLDEVNANDDD